MPAIDKWSAVPDHDNPMVWKRATKLGRRRAHELLADLTDDEVVRYAAVARDQMKIEESQAWLKIVSAIGGTGLASYLTWRGVATGFGGWLIVELGLALTMVYWPWRVLKCRQLWHTHFVAARAEQARRNGTR